MPVDAVHAYHEGERRVQERAGVREMADRIRRSIHPAIPGRAARFLAARRRLILATLDAAGWPWVTILTGPPGFVEAPDPGTLRIEASPDPCDPATAGLRPGRPVGTLAIDFAKRHRSRVNGPVRSATDDVLLVDVDEAYANCPKYIQRRREPEDAVEQVNDASENAAGISGAKASAEPSPNEVRGVAKSARKLSADQLDLVHRADTFFIGTAVPGGGADASHRGGNPGFVRATGRTVVWPDYMGNSMFNTLGNIEAYPPAGLLFVDVSSGAMVQITGTAEIDWDPRRAAEFPGAERLVRLEVRRVVETERRLPGPWKVIEYSPFNPVVPDARS